MYKTEEAAKKNIRKAISVGLKISQQRYEDALVDLIADGMLPLSFVTLPAFKAYTNRKFFLYESVRAKV